MNFEPVIGLEIHIELKTKSKMFSNAPVTYGAYPNSNIAPLDMAFPGTLPVVNKEAIRYAIQFANALNMEIDRELHFDRKNYFYSDLPKGYQITQNRRPIGKEGYLEIETSNGNKKIEIERIHLEEDTCKQLHFSDFTLLNYDRAGIPLIEVVSKPVMRSGEEAMKYVEKIRSIVTFLGISDGKMEEGSLRCDVNISLRPYGTEKFGTKVEIKNLNSIQNIKDSIDFEVNRQTYLLLSGGEVVQETRRFDEGSNETVLMRLKTDAVDYKYFPEPNITPISLSEEFVKDAIESSPELADSKMKRYKDIGLNEYDSNQIIMNRDISNYFDKALITKCSPKLLANWLLVDIQAILNKDEISINEFNISPTHIGELIKLIDDSKISNKQAREIFNELLIKDESPEDIMNRLGFVMVSDDNFIKDLVNQVLDSNPNAILEIKSGHDRVFGYLVGQVMKLSKGKANPSIAAKVLKEELEKR